MSPFLLAPVTSNQPVRKIRYVSVSKIVKVSNSRRINQFITFLERIPNKFRPLMITLLRSQDHELCFRIQEAAGGWRIWAEKHRWQEDLECKKRSEGFLQFLPRSRHWSSLATGSSKITVSSMDNPTAVAASLQGWALSGQLLMPFLQNSFESFSKLSIRQTGEGWIFKCSFNLTPFYAYDSMN